jgi:hypothetical protein
MAEFDPEKARSDFLIAMYNQMMNDINRHIVVVWQSVTALLGAFAAWSLIEKKIISLDIAATLIVLIAIWVIAHVYDAAYWYNRNLVIIANIERQFLKQTDLREIHYYWGKHRGTNSMLTHLRLQRALAVGIALLVLGVQFFQTIIPLFPTKFAAAELQNFLPWAVAIVGIVIWWNRHELAREKYREFLRNSPGKPVDTSGIEYGVGHPAHDDGKNTS